MPAQPRTGRNVPAEGRPDGGAVSQLSLPGVRVELVELPAADARRHYGRDVRRGLITGAVLDEADPATARALTLRLGQQMDEALAGRDALVTATMLQTAPAFAGFCRWRGLDTDADPALQPDRASGDQPALQHGGRIAHRHADRRPPSRRGWPRREPRILASPPADVVRDEIEGPARGPGDRPARRTGPGSGLRLALRDNISGRKLRGWPVSRILFRGRPLR